MLLIWILISLCLTLLYLFVQNCAYGFPFLWHDIHANLVLHWPQKTLGHVGRT